MAEIRLNKLIKQYNIGLKALVEFLNSIGADVDENPNAKVPDTFLPELQRKFGNDRHYGQRAEVIAAKLSDILTGLTDNSTSSLGGMIQSLPHEPGTVTLASLAHRYGVSLDYIASKLRSIGALHSFASPLTSVSADVIPELDQELNVTFNSQHISSKPSPVNSSPIHNAAVSPEEFDWDAFENDCVDDKIKAARDQARSGIVENEIVEGVVTAIGKREVIVNIGYKDEGVISASEFRYDPNLKVGDKVEVYVECAEDRKGQLILSHKKARALKSWDRIVSAYEAKEVVRCYVKTRTKGGYLVDIFGTEAFLPGSQVDIERVIDYDAFVGKNMDVRITQVNQDFRNVVVSRRALLEEKKMKREGLHNEDNPQNNLSAKLAVIEDLRNIIEAQEDMKYSFPKFRKIQERWREIGPVPQQNFDDVNHRYQFLVEKFYDMVQTNRDLQDLDFRANLEKKEKLCEKAEELSEFEDIIVAYKELQRLHEQWKGIGPVASEFRNSMWERFRSATAVINRNYREYKKEHGGKIAHKSQKNPDETRQQVNQELSISITPATRKTSPAPIIDPSSFFNDKAKKLFEEKQKKS